MSTWIERVEYAKKLLDPNNENVDNDILEAIIETNIPKEKLPDYFFFMKEGYYKTFKEYASRDKKFILNLAEGLLKRELRFSEKIKREKKIPIKVNEYHFDQIKMKLHSSKLVKITNKNIVLMINLTNDGITKLVGNRKNNNYILFLSLDIDNTDIIVLEFRPYNAISIKNFSKILYLDYIKNEAKLLTEEEFYDSWSK